MCKKMDVWNASVCLLFVLGDRPSHFGYQRLWGAVGWGTFAIISGLLVDEFSKGRAQKDYTVVFYLMLFMLILDVVVSSRLKVSDKFSFNCVMY
jgi:exosortase/archaeosortase